MPEGLREVIGKRLNLLSAQCNTVLSTAAVIGRDFRLSTLQAVAGVSEEELLTAIEEAVHASILEEHPSLGTVQYRFVHAFFRTALYEELVAPRRIRLHREIANVLETEFSTRQSEHAAEFAYHFGHSSDRGDLVKAVSYGREAAHHATSVYAFGEAVHQLERALQVQQALDPNDGNARCELLLDLSAALLDADEPSRMEAEVAEEAFNLAVHDGNSNQAARAAVSGLLALTPFYGSGGGLPPHFREWFARADQYAEEGSVERVMTDAASDDSELRHRALESARGLDDPGAFHFAAFMCLNRGGLDANEKATLVEEVIQRFDDRAHVNWQACSLHTASESLLDRGELDRYLALTEQVIASRHRAAGASVMAHSVDAEAALHIMTGRLEDALQVLRSWSGETGAQFRRLQMLQVLKALGRFDEYFALVSNPTAPDAFALALAGRMDEAQALLASVDIDAIPLPVVRRVLEGAVLVCDADRIKALVPRLGASPREYDIVGWTLKDRILGDASRVLKQPEESEARYESALELAENLGLRPEAALSRLGLAELFLDHYPDERDAAIEHLDFAIAEFRDMKMQPALERALARRGLLKA